MNKIWSGFVGLGQESGNCDRKGLAIRDPGGTDFTADIESLISENHDRKEKKNEDRSLENS